jgi:hypothetical protein
VRGQATERPKSNVERTTASQQSLPGTTQGAVLVTRPRLDGKHMFGKAPAPARSLLAAQVPVAPSPPYATVHHGALVKKQVERLEALLAVYGIQAAVVQDASQTVALARLKLALESCNVRRQGGARAAPGDTLLLLGGGQGEDMGG